MTQVMSRPTTGDQEPSENPVTSASPSFGAETIFRYALRYHEMGFNVVPLEKPERTQTKKPTCRWKGWQTKRQDVRELQALHHRPTKDDEAHWTHGILAIDGINDIRHFDLDKVTDDSVVAEVLTLLGLPPDYSWVVKSGSGKGYHIGFRSEGDITQLLSDPEPGTEPKGVYFGDPKDPSRFDHLELRWHKSLTTLPPSKHWSGGRYSFVNASPRVLPAQVPINQVIAAFRALATPKREDPPAEASVQPMKPGNPTRLTRSDGDQIDLEERARDRWARKALDEELWQLSRVNKGNRNDSLNKAAFALGQIVGGGLLSEQEVQSSLSAVGQQLGLGKEEILPTVLSGLAAGKKKPRTPPPLALGGAGRGGSFRSGSGATVPPSGRPPSSGPALALVPKKPLIVINGRQEQEVIEDALDALMAANTPEYLFVRSGHLVRLKRDENARPHLEHVTEAMLRLRLLEIAEWAKYDAKGELHNAGPTPNLVQALLAMDAWPFPPVAGVTEIPLYRKDGSLLIQPGYDPATLMIYAPAPSLQLGPIPDQPTQAEVAAALKRIWEYFGEFPYVASADKANALGLLLTPIVRYAIEQHVPLALVDAPKQGSGKSLLTDGVATVTTGAVGNLIQEGKDDEEWRKQITSMLMRGSALMVIDNVDRVLASGRLAAALTRDTWQDRLLSKNEIVDIPYKVTWIANGNNIKLGGDLGSRCYRIRMDAKCSNPSARAGFTHPELLKDIRAARGQILADLLTLIRSWVVAGQPAGTNLMTMRSYTEWARLIGSILEHVGVSDFLGNLEALREEANELENQWYAFLHAWHSTAGQRWMPTKAVVALMHSDEEEETPLIAECLPDFLAIARADKPATFQVLLGKALRNQVDSCFGEENYRLERALNTHTKQPIWRVICENPPAPPSPPPTLFSPLDDPDNSLGNHPNETAGDAGDESPSEEENFAAEDSQPHPLGQDRAMTPATPARTAKEEPSRCQVDGCHEAVMGPVHAEAGAWCQRHAERGEILQLGAVIGYPYIGLESCCVNRGQPEWLRVLRCTSARIRPLLVYLRDHPKIRGE